MKIGSFGKRNNISIDTIRHYMELGLLFPEKKGGQYDFDENCQRDLEMVLEFKEMDFSLNEIKTIALFSSLGRLSPYEESSYYQSIFRDKARKLEEEITRLTQAREKLEWKIAEYDEKAEHQAAALGVDLRNLALLACLKCRGRLGLESGTVIKNQLIDGELACSCGEIYRVESGILIAGDTFSGVPAPNEEECISDYILNTDASYVENVQKGLQLIERRVGELALKGKVMLEPGSGIGFLLRTLYGALPGDCTYVAVDYNFKKHLFLKSMLERTGIRNNILFICADFLSIPLKERSVDIVLDHAGSSVYSFDHKEFLLKEMDGLLKQEANLIGTYILFKNFSPKSRIPAEYRTFLNKANVKTELQKLGYIVTEELESENIKKGGPHENYFVEGEKVYSYMCIAKR